MTAETSGHLTQLLARIGSGDKSAENELFSLVYDELHEQAHRLMTQEHTNQIWQTTELVNAAYLRFCQGNPMGDGRNRGFFFTAMRNAMQKILIEHARKQQAKKRGGNWTRVSLHEVAGTHQAKIDILELEEALEELKRRSQRQYDVVTYRFYVGLKNREVAGVLSVSVSTVEKDWDVAQAWLRSRLKG